MKKKMSTGIALAAAALLTFGGVAAPASAHGTNAWWAVGCSSSYQGSSSYSGATATSYAHTVKSGGWCTNIGVAIRISSGWANYASSTTKDIVEASKAIYGYGGWHSDQNGNVTQHST